MISINKVHLELPFLNLKSIFSVKNIQIIISLQELLSKYLLSWGFLSIYYLIQEILS